MDADHLGFCGNTEDYPASCEAPNLADEGEDVPEDNVCTRDCQVSPCRGMPTWVPIDASLQVNMNKLTYAFIGRSLGKFPLVLSLYRSASLHHKYNHV